MTIEKFLPKVNSIKGFRPKKQVMLRFKLSGTIYDVEADHVWVDPTGQLFISPELPKFEDTGGRDEGGQLILF